MNKVTVNHTEHWHFLQKHFGKGNWGTQWDMFSDVTHIDTLAIFDLAWSL